MRCAEPSFRVLDRPVRIDDAGQGYLFCPGKATWFPEISRLAEDCHIALETGILPKEGSLQDQDYVFVEVFPTFIERWRERTYHEVWTDVRSFSKSILEALFGKGGGGRAPRR